MEISHFYLQNLEKSGNFKIHFLWQSCTTKKRGLLNFLSLKNIFLIIILKYYKVLEKFVIMYLKQIFFFFKEYYKINRRNELFIMSISNLF